MKTYILLSLSLLFVSCSSIQSNKLKGRNDKDAHIISVLSRYPHSILVGGLDTNLSEQIERYYKAKGNMLDDNTRQSLSDYGISIQTDSLTGELIGATLPSGILFGFDEYDLEIEQQSIIDIFLEALNTSELRKTIYIIGHTDSIGSSSYNQLLSERRANSVKTYIEKKYSSTIDVTSSFGLGETKPIATNETEAGRQQNRRVELIVKN